MHRRITLIGLCALLAGVVVMATGAGTSSAAPGGGHKGTIAGVVVDDGGDPVAYATVQLFADIPGIIDYLAETTANGDGEFQFRRVAPGDYTVVAMLLTPGYACMGNAPVTVVSKQTVEVTVEVTCQSP